MLMLPLLAFALSLDSAVAAAPAAPIVEPALSFAPPAPFGDLPPMEYTYVELNYLRTDSDAGGKTLDGAQLVGSFELPFNFFVQASASHQENGAKLDGYTAGAGYHIPITGRFDAFGILSFAHAELSDSPANFNKDGLTGEVGLRFLPIAALELNAGAKWVDIEQSDSGGTVGARYYLMSHFSIGGRYESVGKDESFTLGLRLEL